MKDNTKHVSEIINDSCWSSLTCMHIAVGCGLTSRGWEAPIGHYLSHREFHRQVVPPQGSICVWQLQQLSVSHVTQICPCFSGAWLHLCMAISLTPLSKAARISITITRSDKSSWVLWFLHGQLKPQNHSWITWWLCRIIPHYIAHLQSFWWGKCRKDLLPK